MALELAAGVALLPDHALQRLERRGLAVLGEPLQENLDDPDQVRPALAALGPHGVQLRGHGRLLGVIEDELRQVPGGIGEQHVEDEAHRTGGAFDIGEDGFDGHGDSWDVGGAPSPIHGRGPGRG